ncbi:VOC family protein [Dactylosporangium sp. NBC_01737]|uniref:VOC family protein n=1 Tax=Dactylosporangium sp. NBC_01737 TaxID=2975959 RepID=UPI002E135C62|nr:VOC family protein [Dactylosporangium sp. NBC_01737]
MSAHIAQCAIDVTDLVVMTRFWSAALGYAAGPEEEGGVHLFGAPGAPSVFLQRAETPKPAKNRIHLDLIAEGDVEAAVVRLVGLGARPVDVGQSGAEPFTVLADPEGNEFCLLHVDPRGS